MKSFRYAVLAVSLLVGGLLTSSEAQSVISRSWARVLAIDGISTAPSMAFATEPTLGFWRSSAGNVTLQGALTTTGAVTVGATAGVNWSTRASLGSSANGLMQVANNAYTIGSTLKVDALPTVASGFGVGPSITTGSTPLAGSVIIGTGSPATGVVTFGGTAFPSVPFCVGSSSTTNTIVKTTPTTTQLTLSAVGGWSAADTIQWICISAK